MPEVSTGCSPWIALLRNTCPPESVIYAVSTRVVGTMCGPPEKSADLTTWPRVWYEKSAGMSVSLRSLMSRDIWKASLMCGDMGKAWLLGARNVLLGHVVDADGRRLG